MGDINKKTGKATTVLAFIQSGLMFIQLAIGLGILGFVVWLFIKIF